MSARHQPMEQPVGKWTARGRPVAGAWGLSTFPQARRPPAGSRGLGVARIARTTQPAVSVTHFWGTIPHFGNRYFWGITVSHRVTQGR
jgi:hypothetical protein